METNNTNQSVSIPEAPGDSQTIQDKVNNRRCFLLIALGALAILAIVGGFAYYLGKQNTKPPQIEQNNFTPTGISDNLPTQTPIKDKFTIIVDGKELFIEINKVQNPNNMIMDRIEHHEIAPNKSKIAILAQGSIGTYFLYLSDINGENIEHIGITDEIEWSHNSKYLTYTSSITDIGPHRFYIYEIESKESKELKDDELDNPTKFSNIQWNNDDESILVDYLSYEIPGGKKISSGKKSYRRDQFK